MLSIPELAKATGGELLNPESRDLEGFSIDSRKLSKGDFFIPLPGSRTDGHHYIEEAYEKGATGTFVRSRDYIQKDFSNVILVDNPEKSLLKAAEYYRDNFEIPIIGVTGSWGKTTTKELIASILSKSGEVHKSPGNYNTEYGLPLSLLEMGEKVDYGVFELGLQYPGDISKLSEVLSPTIGLITGVGKAHAEHFGSVREIAREKLKLVAGMKTGSRILINADSQPLKVEADSLDEYELIEYGKKDSSKNYYTSDVNYRGINGLKFKLHTSDKFPGNSGEANVFSLLTLESRLNSEANVYNILGASATALEVGIPPSDLEKGVDIPPLSQRLDPIEFSGGVVIDDTYNANPSATVNALKLLSDAHAEDRRVFVFGDMKELGRNAAALHKELAPNIIEAGVDWLLSVGELTRDLVQEFSLKNETNRLPIAEWFESKSALMDRLAEELEGEDNLILVKGSRSMEMEEVVDFLVNCLETSSSKGVKK